MTYSNLTIMYALPRSMTQWWRWFFSHGCHALHDPLARLRHPASLQNVVAGAAGEPMFIVDTSALYFHGRFAKQFPGHRRLYMLRNPADCLRSARRQGYALLDVAEMADTLWRHAFAEDKNVRLHYGVRFDLHNLFRDVTGREYEGPADPQSIRVDRPLRNQFRNPDNLRALLAHKDTP